MSCINHPDTQLLPAAYLNKLFDPYSTQNLFYKHNML